jgi:hypothetical protein
MTSQSKETEPRISTVHRAPHRRARRAPLFTDGPFAETKELLGGRAPVNAKRR